MNKKDQLAVVISIAYALHPLNMIINGYGGMDGPIMAVAPLVIYWGYRIIKGDISFL